MRNQIGRILLIVCAVGFLGLPRPAAGQAIDESFRADIRKLMEVSGAAQMATQAATMISNSVMTAFAKSQPGISDRAVELVKQVLQAEFAKAFQGPDSLIEQLLPVYEKHFTQDEVKGLLAFYTSPLGKKVVSETPLIFQESAAIGQQWAEKMMPAISAAVEAKLRAEGFVK